MGSALQNHSPMVVLGGRAPAWRWGQGSLQEIDHLPFVRPLARFAATAESPGEIPALIDEALAASLRAPGGPAFVDFPLDHVFSEGPDDGEPAVLPSGEGSGEPDADELGRALTLLAEAERPVVMAGSDLWWGHGEDALLELVEALRRPGVPQRPRARVRARRPPARLLARAFGGAEGRRRRARRRRADGLPARLRRRVRRGPPRSSSSTAQSPSASIRGRRPRSCTGRCRRRCARCARTSPPTRR